jgi:maltose O-acetyltransferase
MSLLQITDENSSHKKPWITIMRMKQKLYLVLYYAIAYNLPNYAFPLGKLFNWIRVETLRKIIPIGDKNRIMRRVYIGDGNNVSIGNNCRINEGVRLDNVSIGNNVLIARESIILGKMHAYEEAQIPITDQGDKVIKASVLEDDVWLGLRVIILPGIIVRKGSIVGAGAVVSKDTEPMYIYGGVPAKVIRKR